MAQAVLAEIGADLARCPSARPLASWAALCSGNRESGGKRLGGATRHGNGVLRAALLQAVWAAVRVKGRSFGAQFRRLLRGRGSKRALLAVAHRLLVVIDHVLRDRAPDRDLGADYFDRRDPATLARSHPRRLMELGVSVTAVPSDAAGARTPMAPTRPPPDRIFSEEACAHEDSGRQFCCAQASPLRVTLRSSGDPVIIQQCERSS